MRTKPIGRSGIEASVVALGTWVMGGWMWGGADEDDSIAAIHAGLDAGINFLDTAPIYGFGHSEIVVGRALKGRRDSVVLATKVGMVPNAPGGRLEFRSTGLGPHEFGHIPVHIYNHPESIRAEVEMSLKRLQTDRIDLIQTHWQEEQTPIEDTMGALMRLKEEGKVRAIGVCNATVEQMDRYRAAGALDSDQEKYSMLDRKKMEGGQLGYCRENGIAVLAYSPLALGLLTGKIGPERVFPEGDLRRTRDRFSVENRKRVKELLDSFVPIAAQHDCTLGQLVIAWTTHQPGLTHALVGARTPEQAVENAKGGAIALSEEDLATMQAGIRGVGAGIV
jgi:aryl-alcohol dehydrogenase-like predicted oxidoreductase